MSVETQNKLFPVFLKLENFRVLIVGGGKVAHEKVSAILNNSPKTRITLVGTQVSDAIKQFRETHPNLIIHQRSFTNSDLENIDFVISAVNNKDKGRSAAVSAGDKASKASPVLFLKSSLEKS